MHNVIKLRPGRLRVDHDGHADVTLTRQQRQTCETLAAFPDWPQAARDVAAVLRELGF